MAEHVAYASELPKNAELVVIGGGALGAATAFYAAQAGLHPVVLERRPALASLTTAAATGAFRLQFDNQVEMRLVSESVEVFENFAEITEQRRYDPDVRKQGYLWLTTSEDRAERQRDIVDRQRAWGLSDVELLGGDDVRTRWPWIAPEVVQARYRAGDGFLDQKKLAFGFAAGSGATVVTDCGVVGLKIAGERLTSVETALGSIDCDAAVIAGGPFSGQLAAMAGFDLPIQAVARHKIVMPDVPEVPRDAPMTIDDDTGAHWRPALAGAYLLHTDPATPPTPPSEDIPPDHDVVMRLLQPGNEQSVARIAPFWKDVWDRGCSHWFIHSGQYSMTPDRRPLIGHSPIEGLFLNTGDSGHGIMTSPGASRTLLDVIVGKVSYQDNPFSPDRRFLEAEHDVL